MNVRALAPLVVMAAVLSGCAGPKTLYQWDGYQSSVYQHYQTDDNSLNEQVAVLEESIEKARANDRMVAPGVHAHLGLLYASSGREQQAMEQFSIEKRLFPESETFMNFLLKQHNREEVK